MGLATKAWIPWASILISSNNFLLSCICRPCFVRLYSMPKSQLHSDAFPRVWKAAEEKGCHGFWFEGYLGFKWFFFFIILIWTFKSDSYDQIFLVLFFIPCGITHAIWCGIKVIFYLAVSYISIFHPSLNVWDYFDIILKG